MSPAALAEPLSRLSVLLEATIDGIDAGLTEVAKSGPPTAGSTGKTRSVQEMVGTLTRLAEDSDSAALDYIESVREELSASCASADMEKLETALRAFDFSAALRVLKSISEKQDKRSA